MCHKCHQRNVIQEGDPCGTPVAQVLSLKLIQYWYCISSMTWALFCDAQVRRRLKDYGTTDHKSDHEWPLTLVHLKRMIHFSNTWKSREPSKSPVSDFLEGILTSFQTILQRGGGKQENIRWIWEKSPREVRTRRSRIHTRNSLWKEKSKDKIGWMKGQDQFIF